MRKTDIERIIKQGSTRQKIKLYFTDVAYFNTKGQYTANFKGSGDSLQLDIKDKILTDKERNLIFNSIKDPKDGKYYDELRTYNRAFLMFMPTISAFTKDFDYLTALFSKYKRERTLHKFYQVVINNILEVVEDKKLREKQVNTALQSLNIFNAKRYQEEGYLPFIEVPDANIDIEVWALVEGLNKTIKEAKEYIEGIKNFLKNYLPLQPYKKFVKDAEDKIKADIEECRKHIKEFTIGRTATPMDKEAEVFTELPDERFNIIRWEDVDAEVTDEDIEDIKNAGL